MSIIYYGLSTLSGLAALLASGGTPPRLFGAAVLTLAICLFMVLLSSIAQ